MNVTKLQKLLFIVYGTYLVIEEGRICDEHPVAWPYGPVFPTSRLIFSRFYTNFSFKTKDLKDVHPEALTVDNNEIVRGVVEKTLNSYGSYSAADLVRWTHKQGSPWSNTVQYQVIDDNRIKEYFERNVVRFDRSTANA